MVKTVGSFVEMHNIRTKEEQEQVERIKAIIEEKNIRLVRVAWADQHGISRAKTLTIPSFLSVLENGLEFNAGPLSFDTASHVVFNPFIDGGGFDMAEMTGVPNYRLIPDPSTFKILPWAPNTGWILTDAYLKDGRPLPFDSRGVLKKALKNFEKAGYEYIAGIEVEWHLFKVEDWKLDPNTMGQRGKPPAAPDVLVSHRGYAYHSEAHLDSLDDILQQINDALAGLGLPLSSIETEFGPCQQEFTFAPLSGLEAADTMLLFKNTVKQISRRNGYMASFMCRPKFDNFAANGWHLHQSVKSIGTGDNLLRDPSGELVSEFGKHFMGGILKHARAATIFTTPTVNGFKRLGPYSLAPDRAGWADDNRGAMLRVVGAPGEKNIRFENRVGEPAANPYLYLASQVIAGHAGIKEKIDPGAPSREAYDDVGRELLPRTLEEAIEALKNDQLYHQEMGELFVDYIIKLKESELDRYKAYVKENNIENDEEIITEWEQREYFELF